MLECFHQNLNFLDDMGVSKLSAKVVFLKCTPLSFTSPFLFILLKRRVRFKFSSYPPPSDKIKMESNSFQ